METTQNRLTCKVKVTQERINCIAYYLAEGYTYKEAAEEFGHRPETIRENIYKMKNEELKMKALRGETWAKRYGYTRKLRPYAIYMARIHSVEETAQKFNVSEDEIKKALRKLKKCPSCENLVKMAIAGARCASKRGR